MPTEADLTDEEKETIEDKPTKAKSKTKAKQKSKKDKDMPVSDTSTHGPMVKQINEIIEKADGKIKILDCGVGSGLIGKALEKGISEIDNIEITGIEIFAPYVEDDKMKSKIGANHEAYKEIHIINFHKFLRGARPKDFDIIIFGDSLEHLLPEYAESSLNNALRVASLAVIVNAPIKKMPQGAVHGNEYEAHRMHWDKEVYESFGGKYLGGNKDVGCFSWVAGVGTNKKHKYTPFDIQKQAGSPRYDYMGKLLKK